MASQVQEGSAENESVFEGSLPIGEKLERARTELLDLSARNRLLNMPRSAKSAKTVDIVDEKGAEIHRLLAVEQKAFTFLPGRVEETEDGETDPQDGADPTLPALIQPEDELDGDGNAARHVDTKLQTRLTSKGLQKRLLDMFYDARTLEEEQGVNILFLAIGALKWIDPQNAANVRRAPLVLVPVSLERGSAGEKFKLRARPDDVAPNLSLEAYLDRVHGIRLPAFDETESFDYASYLGEVADAVSAKEGWEVLADDITLGFFSFAKFLMYRDLDPENWPEGGKIVDRPLIRGLLTEGFEGDTDMVPEDAKIDPHISPSDMLHIVDCDSSQTLVVHEVRQGRDMVVQGPPGTGKSQTIANVIASAVADGKTVLFVAEKMAALEVVKRRLDTTGVGDACLELHSNKANKRAVLDELRRTWELGAPRGQDPGTLYERLTETRDRLNAHAQRMHVEHDPSNLSPYDVIGQLVRLRQGGEKPNEIVLEGALQWTPDDFIKRREVLGELVERLDMIGIPNSHPWRGVGLESMLPTDVERLAVRVAELQERLKAFEDDQKELAETLRTESAERLPETSRLKERADRLARAPNIGGAALGDESWRDVESIIALIRAGQEHAALRSELLPSFAKEAWSTDVTETLRALMELPEDFSGEVFEVAASLEVALARMIDSSGSLSRTLGRPAPTTLAGVRELARIAERVANAPDADAQVFAASLWDSGVERAGDLVENIATFETARADTKDGLLDSAWDVDLSSERAVLASHGEGILRYLSGEWRRANRLVRSFLARPDQSLGETLALLDALATGQAARRRIEEGEELGRAAFHDHWRGERSSSAPLAAIVDWMRSLRGMGSEPRMIASRSPDRQRIAVLAETVEAQTAPMADLLEQLRIALADRGEPAFGTDEHPETADLGCLLEVVTRVNSAERNSSAIMTPAPDSAGARALLLKRLQEEQEAAVRVEAGERLGRQAFGEEWKGIGSDWTKLEGAAEWVRENEDVRVLAADMADRSAPAAKAQMLEAERQNLQDSLVSLTDDLRLDLEEAFGPESLDDVTIVDVRERLSMWADSGEKLSSWVSYRDAAARAGRLGCADVVQRLRDGRLTSDDVVPAFEMAYFEAVYADMVRSDPELGRFDGTLHGRLARDFAEMDRERIAVAGIEVVRTHHRQIPPRDGGAVGPLGILRGEMQRKRGHMPIRKLMERAGPAVQALKPVMMMSPLSVAQFLTPGVMEFDLLVMDEASQIQPVDALGSVARAKQVVVVGDPKQLPPTAFFAKMTGGGDDEDDTDGARVADIESILGLFTARGLPTRMLRWHYRSKHQSLIAVSNRQFYESKLFIVPSPYTSEAGMGLRFHRIADGIFDAGGTRTNQVEARTVAEAIVAHARTRPDLSLGVAAFSAAQRRAILDHLELLRRDLDPTVENFFQAHPAEPFFVKNLENVQGDERDVIFISVGYGPTVPGGRVPMRFGPLGTEGGERRLNVLISRAKQRCEIFSSMTDEDIDPDFASTRKGVFAFRMFLHYARTGRLTIAESTGRDHDSVFEEQVAKALQQRGYQVHRQVGIAGFFVDLAVADEDRPGRYLLGIECDGASYHDAKSARDRDRLRQSVLESHGWTIHRIWSTDWFQRPMEQLDLVVARIEAAKAEHDADESRRAAPSGPLEIFAIEREEVTEIGIGRAEASGPETVRYEEAVLTRPSHRHEDLHETPTGILSEMVEQVVAIEGPVHSSEVVARIRDAWGLKRAGARIQSAVERAIGVSVRMQRIIADDGFLTLPDQEITVRDRADTNSPSLRRADMLPPQEIAVAMATTIRDNLGATRDEIVQSVSRALGIRSTSAQVKGVILARVDKAIAKGELVEQGGMLSFVEPSA